MTDASSLAARLPPPADLERRCIALATLDAILSPDWEYRYYSFNRSWDAEGGTRMGSMRNGSGDEYFVLFFPDGTAALKGLDHESAALGGQSSVPGVLDGLPPSFAMFANEAAFSMETTSFCMWNADGRWRRSDSLTPSTIAQDGSTEMLAMLTGTPADYAAFAGAYFELEVAEDVVARFFGLEPLTDALARAVRDDADLGALAKDLAEIGYPLGA